MFPDDVLLLFDVCFGNPILVIVFVCNFFLNQKPHMNELMC